MTLASIPIETIRSLVERGLTYQNAADILGVSKSLIYSACKRNGITATRPIDPAIPARNEILLQMYRDGKTLQECGDRFGLTRERVRQILNKFGFSERRFWTIKKSGKLDIAWERYATGDSLEDIAKTLGVSEGVLSVQMPNRKGIAKERRVRQFWRMAAVTANPDKCWEWQASRFPTGYGHIMWNSKAISAHRVAFTLFYGRKPSKWVLHHCDNPPCVNPHHLYDGTPLDNVRDRDSRGRQGDRRRRPTPKIVEEIRALLKEGLTQHTIAAKVGFSIACINKIATGRTWTGTRGNRRLEENQVREIRQWNESHRKTAARYGLNKSTIIQIRKGITYKNFL